MVQAYSVYLGAYFSFDTILIVIATIQKSHKAFCLHLKMEIVLPHQTLIIFKCKGVFLSFLEMVRPGGHDLVAAPGRNDTLEAHIITQRAEMGVLFAV